MILGWLTFGSMANCEEDHGEVGGYYLRDVDKRMQAVWDQLNCHSVAITTLKGRMQNEFDDVNARVDDQAWGTKAAHKYEPGRKIGMCRGWCPWPTCHWTSSCKSSWSVWLRYSYGEEYLFWLMEGANRNCKEERNILGDILRGLPYLRSISKIPSRQPLIYVKGIN